MTESPEEHYRSLLQLPSPWQVTSVDSDLAGQPVIVRSAWPSRVKVPCPDCGKLCPIHDRLEERSWRQISVMQSKLKLRCRLLRCRCEGHAVKAVKAPWAELRSRFTLSFEAWAFEAMLACSPLARVCELLEIKLKTSKAWLFKEQRVEFWNQPATGFFKRWRRSIMRCRIPAMKKVAATLKAQLSGLLSSLLHRMTNVLTEGCNSKIRSIRPEARVFRSFAKCRARLLFFCGRLDLYPVGFEPNTHTKTWKTQFIELN